MDLTTYTTTTYRIVNAVTGYWLSGEFTHKENAIKEFRKRKANLEKKFKEEGIEYNPIALIEYTTTVEQTLVEE